MGPGHVLLRTLWRAVSEHQVQCMRTEVVWKQVVANENEVLLPAVQGVEAGHSSTRLGEQLSLGQYVSCVVQLAADTRTTREHWCPLLKMFRFIPLTIARRHLQYEYLGS
jgi:hypothetical protein